MPHPELKPTPEAEAIFRRWLTHLNDEFCRHTGAERRAEIVRDELFQIYLGRPHGGKLAATLTSELGTAVLAESVDPGNVTLEGEEEDDLDWEQYGPRRPLIVFWRLFDRSPLAVNHWLGMRFRCMLGKHIFCRLGRGVVFAEGLRFRRGYTVTIEDGVSFGRNVDLADRQPMTIAARTRVEAGTLFPPA